MTATKHSTTTNALQRIASTEFETAFAEYSRQRAACEANDKPRDWSKGNPLDELDGAFQRMIAIPAPTLEALKRKLEATSGPFAENLGWEAQYYVERFIADARGLLGTGAPLPERFASLGLRADMTPSEAAEHLDRAIEQRDHPNSAAVSYEDLSEAELNRMGDEVERITAEFFAYLAAGE